MDISSVDTRLLLKEHDLTSVSPNFKSKMVYTPLGPNRYQCLIRISHNKMRREKKINGRTKDEGISLQIEPIQLDASPYSLSVGSIRSLETNGILL